MFPQEEKDNMLLCLYDIDKKKLDKLKNIYKLILIKKNDENSKKLFDLFKNYDIPGIEKKLIIQKMNIILS